MFLSILLRLSDPSENWVLEYFGYADFKNLFSLALGRRILELAIFAWSTVLQVKSVISLVGHLLSKLYTKYRARGFIINK